MGQYSCIDEFMAECVKNRSLPIDFIRSDEFLKLLGESDYTYERPYEALHYSRDKKFGIHNDRRSIKLYHEHSDVFQSPVGSKVNVKPGVDLDLGSGYDEYKYYNRSNCTNKNVQRTKLTALEKYEKGIGRKIETDVITSRHTIMDILFSPFGRCDSTYIVSFDGQIFMESKKRSQQAMDRQTMSGYNLESILTVEREKEKKKKFQYVPAASNAEKFNTLVVHNFPSTKSNILISCEVDAAFSQNGRPHGADRFEILENNIELKSRSRDTGRSRQKALLQCFLAGTNNLVVGLRDESLNLRSIKKYNVKNELKSQKGVLSDIYLEKWFNFIVEFIKRIVGKTEKIGKLKLFKLVHLHKSSKVVLNPTRFDKDGLDLVLSPSFIKWRNKIPRRDGEIVVESEELTHMINDLHIDTA